MTPDLDRGRDWYRNVYLRGYHWRSFRADWWRRHPGASCVDCGYVGRLDLDHLTYANLGHETDDDVAPRCRDCHEHVTVLRKVDPEAQRVHEARDRYLDSLEPGQPEVVPDLMPDCCVAYPGSHNAADNLETYFYRHPGATWRDAQQSHVRGCRTPADFVLARKHFELWAGDLESVHAQNAIYRAAHSS